MGDHYMQTRLIFSNSTMNLSLILSQFKKEYGNMDDLFLEIQRESCGNPQKVDDYIIWQAVSTFEKGETSLNDTNIDSTASVKQDLIQFREEILFYTSDFYQVITPKRIELLEYIHKHEPASVKSLALEIDRNYKNVYDDLIALEKFKLIEFIREGKNKRPVSRVTGIEVLFSK
jgi:predicted transcriptional regulator